MTELGESDIKVRFAPSPTGYLHVGGARTALFNFLFARRYGGELLLRIEDTDIERSSEKYESRIIEDLKWLGISWDEGPFRQSQRLSIYEEYVKELLRKGIAYPCYCTKEELEKERQEQINRGKPPRYSGRCRNLTEEDRRRFEEEGRKPVIRFRLPDDMTMVSARDLLRGNLSFKLSALDDFIIMRSDFTPTYNFSVVIDDHLMGITHVIRAEEHLSNTPKQILLYRAFGWNAPLFIHVPVILGSDRTKMSKRHGATSIRNYRERGVLPEAMVNYLVLLGWSHKDGRELFTLDELIREFSIEGLSKSPSMFDEKKLLWMNNYYIRNADLERIVKLCMPYLRRAGFNNIDKTNLKKAISAVRDSVSLLSEVPENIGFFFSKEIKFEAGSEKILSYPHVPRVIKRFSEYLMEMDEVDADSVLHVMRRLLDEFKMGGRKVIMPLRVAITGRTKGPELYNIVEILGREETLRRLENTYRRLIDGG